MSELEPRGPPTVDRFAHARSTTCSVGTRNRKLCVNMEDAFSPVYTCIVTETTSRANDVRAARPPALSHPPLPVGFYSGSSPSYLLPAMLAIAAA